MAQPRFAATVVGLFAGLGVTLAALGLFAVLSYAVNQRRRELSVRAALGASPGRLLRLILGHGLALALEPCMRCRILSRSRELIAKADAVLAPPRKQA